MDPPAILDPIIMTLACFYQRPDCIEPLEPDCDKSGKKSDHKIVIAKPINKTNPLSVRVKRQIKSRPITSAGIKLMQDFLISESWSEVLISESAHKKAEIFQSKILKIYQDCFPEKVQTFADDDQPWITNRLKILDRKRKRIFRKERQSEKWCKLNKLFKKEIKHAKKSFYQNMIADLKHKKPGQWYSALKRISSHDIHKKEKQSVFEINHL